MDIKGKPFEVRVIKGTNYYYDSNGNVLVFELDRNKNNEPVSYITIKDGKQYLVQKRVKLVPNELPNLIEYNV